MELLLFHVFYRTFDVLSTISAVLSTHVGRSGLMTSATPEIVCTHKSSCGSNVIERVFGYHCKVAGRLYVFGIGLTLAGTAGYAMNLFYNDSRQVQSACTTQIVQLDQVFECSCGNLLCIVPINHHAIRIRNCQNGEIWLAFRLSNRGLISAVIRGRSSGV